ncbi:hypothetical protein AB0903_03715 [Streptomyces sp. NPDC048389]|uniref:hypothetical protein n=1 Tax=Streptomyces sp. NPDC048389 TaxID=3154622 RepID=UPI00345297DD
MNHPPAASGGAHGYDDDDYSATELASHWFERPDPQAVPDRVEGDVLRFGPGVTAFVRQHGGGTTATAVWHGTLAGQQAAAPPPRGRRRGLRRYALAALVLALVLGFFAWQRFGPRMAVRDVAVTAPQEGPGCDGTADVVGVVRTDGRPGTLSYRWVRSDGTRSGVLRREVARGQRETRLRLLWTFRGRGEYRADAELRLISPSRHTGTTSFLYRCP